MIGRERGRDVSGSRGVVFWSWSVVCGGRGRVFRSRGVVGGFWSMVCWCRSIVLGSRGVVLGGSGVVSLSIVGDISHKALVAIGVVADMLDASIRKVDRVGSLHIARSVAALASAEHSLGVVVGYGVVVGVGRDFISICWFRMVGRFCRCVVGRSMVCWDSFNNWSVICRSCLYNRSMVRGCHFSHRSMVGRSRSMISWGGSMVGWSSFDDRSMVGWSGLVVGRGGCGMVGWCWCMVGWGGWVIDRGWCVVARGLVREGGRCKVCSGGLLAVAVPVHALGRCVGLADHTGVHCPVRLVHAVAHRGRVALLDHLVAALVGHRQRHGNQAAENGLKIGKLI